MDTTALAFNPEFDAACRRHQAEIDLLRESFRGLRIRAPRLWADLSELTDHITHSETRLGKLASQIGDEAGILGAQRDAVHRELGVMTWQNVFEAALPREIGDML